MGIGLFFLIPWILNFPVHQEVAHLQRQDNTKPSTLELPRSLGLIQQNLGDELKKKANCEELCLRLLLNGSVDTFLEQGLNSNSIEITPETPVTRYWIESRKNCPERDISNKRTLRTEFADGQIIAYSADIMRDRIGEGQCLLSEPATVSVASMVIFMRKIPPTKESNIHEISRISAYKVHENRLEEVYRATEVKAERYAPFLLLGFLKYKAEFQSSVQLVAKGRTTFGSVSLETLLEKAHVNLDIASVPEPDYSKNLRTGLPDGTSYPNDPKLVDPGLLFKDIKTIGYANSADIELVTALLYDSRFTAMEDLPDVIPHLVKASSDNGAGLAIALLERLQSQNPEIQVYSKRFKGSYYLLGKIGEAIRALPERSLGKALPTLIHLSKDSKKRAIASAALTHLGDFGQPGVEALMWLLEENQKDTGISPTQKNQVFHVGMIGLCRAGRSAEFVGMPLIEGVIKERVQKKKYLDSTNKLIIRTLTRMRVPPDDIWTLYRLPGIEREQVNEVVENTSENKEESCR
ncbi:MAG: hypothetical protein AB7P32_03125 [Nitrospirales bacterium]